MKLCAKVAHFQMWLAYDFPRDTTLALHGSPALAITAASHVECDYRACEEISIAIQSQRKAPGTDEGWRDGTPQDRRAQVAPEPPRTYILAVRTDVGDG